MGDNLAKNPYQKWYGADNSYPYWPYGAQEKHEAWQEGYDARQPEVDALKDQVIGKHLTIESLNLLVETLNARIAELEASGLDMEGEVLLRGELISALTAQNHRPAWQDGPDREGWWLRAVYYRNEWEFTSVLITKDDVERGARYIRPNIRWQFNQPPDPPKE